MFCRRNLVCEVTESLFFVLNSRGGANEIENCIAGTERRFLFFSAPILFSLSLPRSSRLI